MTIYAGLIEQGTRESDLEADILHARAVIETMRKATNDAEDQLNMILHSDVLEVRDSLALFAVKKLTRGVELSAEALRTLAFRRMVL